MPVVGPSNTITRSATDFIKSALRLVGALRSGNNLSGDELRDCQQVLNDMLDAFSAERVNIPTTNRVTLDQNQAALTLKANQATYALGNVNGTEDFLIPRPSRLERVSVLYSASQQTPVELGMDMYDDVQWQGVPNKTTPSLLPQVCYVEENFPDLNLSFWPVPTQANPVVFYLWATLTQFSDLTSQFSFPPAYSEMLRYNLAVRLAAEFPCDLQKMEIVQKLASEAYGRVAGINVRAREASCDEALLGSDGVNGNIYTGTSNRSHKF